MKTALYLLFIVVLSGISRAVIAQNEVLREINSLYGIQSFGIAVNMERPGSLDEVEFRVENIQKALQKNISKLPVQVIPDTQLRESDQYPMLILHINIMDAGNGTYPYAADLTFYQPVKLSLNQDLGTMAATWQTALVGIVSADKFEIVATSSIDLADEFVQDFLKVNL